MYIKTMIEYKWAGLDRKREHIQRENDQSEFLKITEEKCFLAEGVAQGVCVCVFVL